MKEDQNYFTHLVLFWLKDADKDGETLLAALKKLVAESKYSKFGHIGVAAGTDRPVVDNSYDYSLLVTFSSQEDHDQYQTEQAHLDFLEVCKPLWEKVQIYDALRVED
ncbi:Dabb family protein [Reichenbachiella versicolor]|uniref:Dabb family protein n=1 Tax=Reichenbachiella versicolor TaxID=1821036 RepID=UPI000D6DE429|nr:Dabb family protein [Reichenbachiella versicolor]